MRKIERTFLVSSQRQGVIRRLVLRHLWSMEMRNRSSTSTVQELDRARQDLARLLMPLSAANQELRDKQSQEQLDKVLYCIVIYCIVLYCIVSYCIVLYCIVLYCIVLCCVVLFCVVLYCIVL